MTIITVKGRLSFLLVLYIVALLLPFHLSRVGTDSRCATFEAIKPLLLVEETMRFFLLQLLTIRLNDYTSCSLVFLPNFELLLSVGVEPPFLVFDWSLSWVFIVRKTSITRLEAWFLYFYLFQIFKEHPLSF